jgi:Arc/MetJ-type ribon-helix-helix transcriptional regulator
MKVSISLPGEDVRFLDAYAQEQGLDSRSAAIHRAVRLLRVTELGAAYQDAWLQWERSDAEAWEPVAADGMGTDAPG